MSKDQVHLARFVLDALDGQIVDAPTDGALTPLSSSVLLPDAQTRCKFVELLLRRGASVNCRDGRGRTALSYACEWGHLDAVMVLVRNNADPEVVDVWGNSALMYAAVAGHSPVVHFLVRAFKRLGLQIHRQNQVGNSAVGVAKHLGHSECLLALTGRSREGGGSEDNPTQTPGSGPRMKQSRLPSMDSIEEWDGETGSASQELVFSGVLTPKPPARKQPAAGDDHLARLNHTSTSTSVAPSALDLLLTPVSVRRSEEDPGADVGGLRCHRSHRQKRRSLPTSLLSPAPPERQPRTVRRCPASPCGAEPPRAPSPAGASSLSVLGSKLLRRFTSPEMKRAEKEMEQLLSSGRIPRSETFPQSPRHPQVGGKASVDSISSVTCEFDIHCGIHN